MKKIRRMYSHFIHDGKCRYGCNKKFTYMPNTVDYYKDKHAWRVQQGVCEKHNHQVDLDRVEHLKNHAIILCPHCNGLYKGQTLKTHQKSRFCLEDSRQNKMEEQGFQSISTRLEKVFMLAMDGRWRSLCQRDFDGWDDAEGVEYLYYEFKTACTNFWKYLDAVTVLSMWDKSHDKACWVPEIWIPEHHYLGLTTILNVFNAKKIDEEQMLDAFWDYAIADNQNTRDSIVCIMEFKMES